ncbi:MAG TPA: hypothetical protein VES93_05325 [Ornithinibacter sp.]|nr:hypothetical protein [Ornithinibacter sp.]
MPTRRVTLLPEALARIEPRAVDAIWLEARDTVDGDWAMPAGIVATDTLLDGVPWMPGAPDALDEPAGPGDPQTSQ